MEQAMTPEEFAKRMNYLVVSNPGDPEGFHMAADTLMENVLIQLGYKDGIDIFAKTKKWYT